MSQHHVTSITVDLVLAQIHKKHPHATIDKNVIVEHQLQLAILEIKYKLTKVGVRAITLPQPIDNEDGTRETVGKKIFHFACFHGENETREIVIFNIPFPGPPCNKSQHILNKDVSRHQYVKKAWQDLHDCFPEGFNKKADYFKPQPDKPATVEDTLYHATFVARMKAYMEHTPQLLPDVHNFAHRYILVRYHQYLHEYHQTNNPYWLTRADFFRKIKTTDLSEPHLFLLAVAAEGHIDDYFVEHMLRTTYTEKIESL